MLFHRVLLIEDDSSHALLVKRALKQFVASVEHCTSMPDAIERGGSFVPDLIISDLNLGSDVAVEHFSDLQERTGQTPIIVLTASTSLTDAVEAMRRGARDFIVKNFDKDFAEILGFSLSRLAAALALESEQRRLRHQIEILQVAIENSVDGLAVADSNGQVSYFNSAFERYILRAGGSIKSVHQFLGETVKEGSAAQRMLSEQFSDLQIGGVYHTEINFIGEKDFALDLSVVSIKDSVADACCIFLARDITELRKRQRFQREVLSTTTHDLKGPLGAIMSSAELIPHFIADSNKVEQIALRVGSSARTALNLIEEFLSARRIQEGSFILHPKECNYGELVSNSIADFSNMATVRGLTLSFEQDSATCTGKVDSIGYGRVVSNLISNAIKFTPKGGSITVSLAPIGDSISLRIQDTGNGMEPNEVKQLFGRFSRLDRHQEIAGTGLGLFVVKAIVSAHGGSINVTSAVGKGTTFEVNVPVEPPMNERGEVFCLDFD